MGVCHAENVWYNRLNLVLGPVFCRFEYVGVKHHIRYELPHFLWVFWL